MVNKNLLALTKKGVYIVNTARGAIIERDDLVDFVNKGHVAGYAGDVWFPQPAPKGWFRKMKIEILGLFIVLV